MDGISWVKHIFKFYENERIIEKWKVINHDLVSQKFDADLVQELVEINDC